MIVDPDFLDHWRTGMVVAALQDQLAPFYILRIWGHCQHRKKDRFESMPAAGLAALCRFHGDAEALERALVDGRFIARDGADILVLDWAEKNASLLAAWENGLKGGRPPKPKQNPRVSKQEPNGNPDETQTKPIEIESRNTSSSLRSEEGRASAPACPDDVDPQVWGDWRQLRKAKRAPISATAIAEARKEAEKAGMTLEAFLRVWCGRGSQGLRAEWLTAKERATGPPAGRHTGFETKNYRQGVTTDGSLA